MRLRTLLALLAALVVVGCGPDPDAYPQEDPETGEVYDDEAQKERGISADEQYEIDEAIEDVQRESRDLRNEVDALSYADWESQYNSIESEVDDYDRALRRLEALEDEHGIEFGARRARSELDDMVYNLERLHYENWRHVTPDVEEDAGDIESSSTSLDPYGY